MTIYPIIRMWQRRRQQQPDPRALTHMTIFEWLRSKVREKWGF